MNRPYKCPTPKPKYHLPSLSLSVSTLPSPPSLSLPRSLSCTAPSLSSEPVLRLSPTPPLPLPHAVTGPPSPAKAHGVAPPSSPRGGTRRRTLARAAGVLGRGFPAVARRARWPPPAPAVARGPVPRSRQGQRGAARCDGGSPVPIRHRRRGGGLPASIQARAAARRRLPSLVVALLTLRHSRRPMRASASTFDCLCAVSPLGNHSVLRSVTLLLWESPLNNLASIVVSLHILV